MMLRKLDSLVLYVTDTHKTADFYQKLGFEIATEEDNFTLAKLGDFELHCSDKISIDFPEESDVKLKGAGISICIDVENIDEYFKNLKEKGLKPFSEPQDKPWGNKEFDIRDPDGYKLVFYEPLAK